MLFTENSRAKMLDDSNFPSGLEAITFEFWLRPQHDAQVVGLQPLLQLYDS